MPPVAVVEGDDEVAVGRRGGDGRREPDRPLVDPGPDRAGRGDTGEPDELDGAAHVQAVEAADDDEADDHVGDEQAARERVAAAVLEERRPVADEDGEAAAGELAGEAEKSPSMVTALRTVRVALVTEIENSVSPEVNVTGRSRPRRW